jgi:hypothetical protein
LTVDGVRIQSDTERWVTLEVHKGCIVVLTKAQFLEGLRRGKWWKRAVAMRARYPDAATSDDRRRGAKDRP